MLSKKEIKDIQSLGYKKFRDEAHLFVAEGPKIVLELAQLVPQQIVKIYSLEAWANENSHLPNLQIISEPELQKISGLQTPNQVVALLKQFQWPQPNVSNSFCVYLDAIQDPGNMGTIIRIADWFGVAQIVCGSGCADVYNSKVVQSTMASIARVPVWYDENGNWLAEQKVPIYAATLQGKPLGEFSKVEEGILIIGNESKGISAQIMAMATHGITIPKKGEAESLNAAVATGIILSHLLS